MPIYDSGFKIVAHHAGRQLAHLGRVVVDAWQPLVSEFASRMAAPDGRPCWAESVGERASRRRPRRASDRRHPGFGRV